MEFARGVALIADEDFEGALPLVTHPALEATPLVQYARYYAGVALLGLERAGEAVTMLAPLEGKVAGALQDAVPLRLAEAALAREAPAGGGERVGKGERLHVDRARKGAAAPRCRHGGGGRVGQGAAHLSACLR